MEGNYAQQRIGRLHAVSLRIDRLDRGESVEVNRLRAILTGIAMILTGICTSSALAQDGDIAVPESGLQTEIEPVGEEMDWRAEVGLLDRDPRESREWPAVVAWILANLVTLVMVAIALVVIGLVILLLVKHGGGGGLRLRAEARAGEREPEAGVVSDALTAGPSLTLDEILKLDDLELALGALLRLVLETAISLSGHVLRRSATAREVLRRLPSDFAHLGAVAALVREAEHVRYGGASISRERFDALVEQIRPLLSQVRAS